MGGGAKTSLHVLASCAGRDLWAGAATIRFRTVSDHPSTVLVPGLPTGPEMLDDPMSAESREPMGRFQISSDAMSSRSLVRKGRPARGVIG